MKRKQTYNYSEEQQRKAYINLQNQSKKSFKIEVPVLNRCVDLVIFEKNQTEITAIEFKLKHWKKALEQALKLTISFDYIIICIMEPKNLNTKSLIIEECENKNIGLIFAKYVNNSYEFKQALAPIKQTNTWMVLKNKILKILS